MSALKESIGLAATIASMAFAATAASLPPNLARSAKATATSEFSGQYLAQFAVDGKIPEAGSQEDLNQAWCVRGDTHRHGAELTLEWTNPVTIAEVVYYGRTAWFAEECWCFAIVPATTLKSWPQYVEVSWLLAEEIAAQGQLGGLVTTKVGLQRHRAACAPRLNRIRWPRMRQTARKRRKLDYPEETEGSRLAAKIRKLASKLTPEEEAEYFRRGMAKIYGSQPKENTGAGH